MEKPSPAASRKDFEYFQVWHSSTGFLKWSHQVKFGSISPSRIHFIEIPNHEYQSAVHMLGGWGSPLLLRLVQEEIKKRLQQWKEFYESQQAAQKDQPQVTTHSQGTSLLWIARFPSAVRLRAPK